MASVDDLLIVSGGLETINLTCQLFINPGDVILVESPSFIHAIEIFDMFEAKCIAVETDDEGILPEAVQRGIEEYDAKMIYVIPTFQNPTGRTLSLVRRKQLAEIVSTYGVILLEDDSYAQLRYSGNDIPPIKAFDQTGHTIFAGSFSKIFSSGARLGYCCTTSSLMEKFCDVKSATNSHSSALVQVLCAEYFKHGYFSKQNEIAIHLYRERRDLMVASAKKYLPDGTHIVYPDGGLFLWVELLDKYDATGLLEVALKQYHVGYVAGESFYVERNGLEKNCMRLSFGNVTQEDILIGMERLGQLFEK